jgi:hypothetical protein
LNIVATRMTNTALKTLRRTALRAPIVLLAALAWLAISNHCALAALEGSAEMIAAPTCHGMPDGQAPAKQKNENDVECCKVLRATLTGLSKNLVAQNVSSFALQAYFTALFSLPAEPRPVRSLELDTGPPGSNSFAETVLQRSLRAHAPPILA